MKIAIGKRIRKARLALDLKQKEVSKLVGFSAQALSAIESGATVEPDRSNLIALAKALKNDFEEEWLTEYATNNSASASKQEIIKEMPIEEIISIKFPGNNSRRSKEELIRTRDFLNSKLAEMSDEE